MYKIIDGKKLAANIRSELKKNISEYKSNFNEEIGLAVVMVGNNPASQVYVRNKIKACEEVGIKSYAFYLPEETSQKQLEDLLYSLAEDKKVNGILVQLPLPEKLNAESALKIVPFEKDVDGFSAENVGKLSQNSECLVACTPNGVMKMFESENISLSGKKAVVIGRSDIVGKPMAMLLLNANATVTVCHSKTQNLKEECLSADILVAAVGKAKFVTVDMVKEGAVVIDVGMNRGENGKLCGDVDFENVKKKCSYITPVPGGVGPMTITMLLYNTYITALRSKS
ncbi:MAG: bifunctional methylenetetrahydrofolate dehydrogenase/methenyltetrahydrofolate cyclohydrolase FolD [Clostridia bacterium]|nr:bifunctional methylenetetrahydrofolate dehydrogenase/methenyltetrahydrofolate cyclohydrolase FolD [Clostridia bacterium]